MTTSRMHTAVILAKGPSWRWFCVRVNFISMLTASSLSVRIASANYRAASAIASRHVHTASSAQPVRVPHSLGWIHNQRLLQWRCYASKVKNMPTEQLKEKEGAAEAGAEDPGANDHYDKVADKLGKDCVERMGKALFTVQEALASMTVRGISADQ